MGRVDKKLVFSSVFVILFVFEGAVGRSIDEEEFQDETETGTGFQSHRNSRLFPLFPWNKPKSSSTNTACGSGIMAGTCQSSKYCKLKGGNDTMPMTRCDGKNVCCQIAASCASDADQCSIRESGIMMIHDRTNTPYQRRYVFPRINGACQLKLDLVLFNLGFPTAQGNCEQDSMTITGSPTVKRFRICGNSTGQTLYLDYGSSDMIRVTMNVKQPMTTEFVIRPTFIRCDSNNRVPAHCLQYLKEPSGKVQSFNWPGNFHLSNLDYTVCIKSPDDTTEIQWKECADGNGNQNQFFVSGNLNNPVGPTIDCEKDYVEIYGGGRHCGTAFPPTVTSSAKPLLLNVHFDGDEIAPIPPVDAAGGCMSDDTYDCQPEGGAPCTCTLKPGAQPLLTVEILNTGFCLEYSQL